MLTSLPSVSAACFDVHSCYSARQLFDRGHSPESTNANQRHKRDERSDQNGESPDSSAGVKVLDTLFQVYLQVCHKTDQKSYDRYDVLNDEEFVGSTGQSRRQTETHNFRKLAKLEKTIQAIKTIATVPLANRASFVKYLDVTASSCHSSPIVSHFEWSIVPVWIIENKTGRSAIVLS